ncbi:MAG: protein kinase domain-containing protein, partial [Gemmatimonadales bacterium]
HRDIKPENILLSGGHAVVADFGVAKALERGTASETAASTRLTRAGLAIGTPHYMSPEQATGADVVDARADQYSLGCVLYEMLAGEPPFAGSTPQSVVAQSLTAPRPRIGRVRDGVSPALEQVVLRTMALDPAERYPDMTSLGAALRDARETPASPARRPLLIAGGVLALAAVALAAWLVARSPGSDTPGKVASAAEALAVLPFHTSGPGMEFLGEGMVDLLATNLRGVGGIHAVDPRAVLREWRTTEGASDDLVRALAVGRALDAGSVVVGSAVSTGGRMRLAADLYTVAGERLGRAQVDGPADSVLAVVDRLSLALLRDVWRSREPLPNLRLALLTTDSIEALRAYLQGEQQYRRLAFDSALSAYTRAVEVDSTFALAHLRRAVAFGWTGGYGSEDSRAAAEAGLRFAGRLPARDRRLLMGYQLFDRGKPASVDSLSAYVADYPTDVEGWYLLGEALFHTRTFRPVAPESISAVFDSVLRRDSTLFPALIHPAELAILYADSARFARYFSTIERAAPPQMVSPLRTAAGFAWGPEPTDKALRTAMALRPTWIITGAFSAFRQEASTSDTVLQRFAKVQRAGPQSAQFVGRALAARTHLLAGLGRWREARVLADSLQRLDPEEAMSVQAWAIASGLAPAAFDGVLDSAVGAVPPGPEAEYARGMLDLLRGRTAQGRRRIGRALVSGDWSQTRPELRGLMVAAGGWGAILQGDSAAGLRRLRSGLEQAAAPGMDDETVFLRFQLALALAAREETRAESIEQLRYGFDMQTLFIPAAQLALGRTYESAGMGDSAAAAYRRFLGFWDGADAELQGRVVGARQALEEVTAERPRSP